ncbi:MAG: type II secretion system GspH family protein [Synergistaceae bacterium]|nr:type II secretion system GspH family protein [Synergistaceae bacterium]
MAFNVRRQGFSLVELMLVVIFMGILAGVLMLNMSSSSVVDSRSEARRLEAALQSLKSAWISYYADKHVLLGVPATTTTSYAASSSVVKDLERYSDRDLTEDIRRYGGSLAIRTKPGDTPSGGVTMVYLGFSGAWDLGMNEESMRTMQQFIKNSGMNFVSSITTNPATPFDVGHTAVMVRVK